MSHVYCPECGYQNPEAAHYCAKCGRRSLVPEEPGPRRRDVHRRRAARGASTRSRTRRPTAPALIVRSGGGRAGETSRREGEPDDDRPLARVRRSSSTTSPSPASTPCSSHATATACSRGPGQPERHLRQPRSAIESAALAETATSSRSASTGSRSSQRHDGARPSTARAARLRSRSAPSAGTLKDEFPDISISKIRYLEDQGLLEPEAHAGRLPALRRGRRRAAGDDPAAPARRVPAAARDPGGARIAGRRQGSAAGGAPSASPAGGGARASRSSASAPASRPSARASWRSSGCSSRASRTGSEQSTPRPTRTSPRRAKLSRLRDRAAAPARLPHRRRPRGGAARGGASRPRCARGTPSAAQAALGELQTLARAAQELSTAPVLARRAATRE